MFSQFSRALSNLIRFLCFILRLKLGKSALILLIFVGLVWFVSSLSLTNQHPLGIGIVLIVCFCITLIENMMILQCRTRDSGLGREKHPGLRLRGSGKWGVQIYHPVEGKVIWLGTYDTIEEAKNVYQKKKLEMASLRGLVNKHKTPICAKDSESGCKSYKGVRQKRPGRWSAEIKDPFKRKRLHLGTFNTPEEAADAYAKKRREFDDALMALGKKSQRKGEAAENSNSTVTAVSSQDSQGNNCTEHAEDEFGVGVAVINSYGQLIGEYSRIDDDLWLTGL